MISNKNLAMQFSLIKLQAIRKMEMFSYDYGKIFQSSSRSSRPEMFCEKGILKNLANSPPKIPGPKSLF